MSISAIVIVKNGEDLILDCLDSLSFCDEIIVIDGGSEDKTAEIAEKKGAVVYRHETEDFSESRNFGLEKTAGKWVLYVDVDERVTPELAGNIRQRIVTDVNSGISAYKVLRKNYYFGNYPWPYIEKLERLFKKDKLKGWQGKLHESPVIEGKVGELEGYLLHYTHRDLTSMVNKTLEWSKTESELRFSSNHPKMTWWRFPRVMITAFFNSYIRQGGYKIGTAGLIESIYQSFSMFITYARLWEMQDKVKSQKSKVKSSI
ncbi:MAG: glycosyltransferase family 2 protein [Patescibacteria group bacterium]|nr:glycosyltransferase family 2 protein [Patescibacteria group bacterium]